MSTSPGILDNIQILKEETPEVAKVLTPDALAFVVALHRTFNPTREMLLSHRVQR
ncbi:MAG: malate synthase A, partial [Anaerolineae bacterium]|nr:malate synthase A [Anaerolineae bacterium]